MALSLSALKSRIDAVDKEWKDLKKSLEKLVNDYIRTLHQQSSPVEPLEASIKYLNFFANHGITLDDFDDAGNIRIDIVPPGSQEGLGYDTITEVLNDTLPSFRKVLESTKYTLHWHSSNDGQLFFLLQARGPNEKK